MENNFKNELGHIYGSRISKNGKWLNLIVTTNIKGENYRLTIPVRLEEEGNKPYAEVLKVNAAAIATIHALPVYEDKKREEKEDNMDCGDLPF